jgi:hypothetical protein
MMKTAAATNSGNDKIRPHIQGPLNVTTIAPAAKEAVKHSAANNGHN